MSVALIWAIAWLPVGVLVGVAMGWLGFRWLVVWTLLGASAGAVFAILLSTLERRRTLDDLSPRRLTIWGAVGGAGIPVIASVLIDLLIRGISLTRGAPVIFGILALVGAACAWATLRVARRGVSDPERREFL